MNEWRIHRREPRCGRCERAFAEGEAIFSLLFFDAGGLKREDRCQGCFEGAAPAEPAGPDPLIFWRTRHDPDRRARFAVDFEAIEELFLTLDGRSEGRLPELRYLLTLLLLRKKRLKLVGVRRHGTEETLCVRRPRRAEEFEVRVFELDAERAATLKAELARVFEGAGVEAMVTSPPAEAGAAPGSEVAEDRSLESAS